MVEDTAPYFSHFPLPDMTFQTRCSRAVCGMPVTT